MSAIGGRPLRGVAAFDITIWRVLFGKCCYLEIYAENCGAETSDFGVCGAAGISFGVCGAGNLGWFRV